MKQFSPQSWNILTQVGITQLLILVIGLGSSSLWAHHVSKQTYGEYQLIISLVKLAGSFCLSGLESSIVISAARGYEGNLSRILRYKWAVNMVGSVALMGAALYYRNAQPSVFLGLIIAAVIFPLYEMQKIWPSWIRGKKQLNLVGYLETARVLLAFLLLCFLLLLNQKELNVLLVSIMGLNALFSTGVVFQLFRNRVNNRVEKESIQYGFHATLATLLGGLVLTDRMIINECLSVEQVALYSIALLFPEQIRSLYSALNQMMFPQLAKAHSVTEAWQYLRRKLPWLSFGFFTIGITGFVLLPKIIPFFFSEKYAGAVPYAKWLWLGYSMAVPATYLGNILRAQKKLRFLYFFELLNPIVVFILFLSLIHYGIAGIVLARVFYYFSAASCFFAFFLYYLRKEINGETRLAG